MYPNFTNHVLTTKYTINCVHCGQEHSIQESQSFCTTCGHGFPLEVNYAECSPFVQLPNFIIDLEQLIPSSLIKLEHYSNKYNSRIFAKCENDLPTGSFKHRGSVIEVMTAKQYGYHTIVCASTGNMGVSLAALCAKHHIKLILFVPKTTPSPKLAASRKYGAQIHYIDGAYSECEVQAALYAKEKSAFLAGDYYLRAEGAKLVSAEILDQLGGNVPDMVIVPGGVGTNASAIAKGFIELACGGLVETIPQLVVVQSEKCCPIIDSLEAGILVKADHTNTLCSATAVANPYDFKKVQKCVTVTDGFGLRVSDELTLKVSKDLAEIEGIDAELSGAMPLAALEQAKNKIEGKTVVLLISGAGFKDLAIQEEAYSKLLNQNI